VLTSALIGVKGWWGGEIERCSDAELLSDASPGSNLNSDIFSVYVWGVISEE